MLLSSDALSGWSCPLKMDLSVFAEFRGGTLRTGLSGPQDCLQPWAECEPSVSEDTWLG